LKLKPVHPARLIIKNTLKIRMDIVMTGFAINS
jgi:hypothetical protein